GRELRHDRPRGGVRRHKAGRGQVAVMRRVVVCGAGAAGMAAAIAAARSGASVTLVEAADRTGGTVADCLIHTIGGLFDDRGEILNPGLPAEPLHKLQHADSATRKRRIGRTWVLDADPDLYRDVTSRWLESCSVNVRTSSRVVRVVEANRRIASMTV